MISVHSLLATVYLAVGLLVGLVVHEFAHAWMATRFGDHTPRLSGRLTLDPRPHLDPFGSLLFPAILLLPVIFGRLIFPIFAYAKPMELNPWTLRKQDQHLTLIAVAGPIANIALAFVFGGLFRVAGGSGELASLLSACLLVNVTLGVMNIIPVPPLDGSRIIARFLPPRAKEFYTNLDQYGALFMLLIFFLLGGVLIFPFVRVISDGICALAVGTGCPPI